MPSAAKRLEALAFLAFIVWIVLPSPRHRHHAEPVSLSRQLHSLLDSGLGDRAFGRVYHHLHACIAGPE